MKDIKDMSREEVIKGVIATQKYIEDIIKRLEK